MRRLVCILFALVHTKLAVTILVQDHHHHHHQQQQHQQQQQRQRHNDQLQFGYLYNKPAPSLSGFKPVSSIYPSYAPLQSSVPGGAAAAFVHSQQTLSPLSFHPTASAGSSLTASHHFHSGHLPQSIHFDIPPAVLHNFISPHDEIYFADDGRLLKQYEVMERIIGDLEHQTGGHLLGSSPLYLDSLVSKFVAQNPNLVGQLFQPVTRNHGPIALGSGSLGYIQLTNGVAHLGSGSLGYISGQQANQAVVDAKTRKALAPPGPLHFGHSFVNK